MNRQLAKSLSMQKVGASAELIKLVAETYINISIQ